MSEPGALPGSLAKKENLKIEVNRRKGFIKEEVVSWVKYSWEARKDVVREMSIELEARDYYENSFTEKATQKPDWLKQENMLELRKPV